jgi:ligand-binding SRPBCC domain-containing protein
MPTIVLETFIAAPAQVCFDLVRDVRVHTRTTARTHDMAASGTTARPIGLGQTVTFEGTHLGVRQRLKVEVVEFERPLLFVDEMIEGAFKSFRHVHEFIDDRGSTLMRDTLEWKSPFGLIGKVFDKLLLERHMAELVTTRNAELKRLAERLRPAAP